MDGVKVGKEHADSVGCNGNEHVPDSVQVGSIVGRPGITEETVENPGDHGTDPAETTPNTQTLHTLYSATKGDNWVIFRVIIVGFEREVTVSIPW